MLLAPPLMWAGNAVVGRMMVGVIPPFTMNFMRWALALLILLPLAFWVLKPGSGFWPHWRRFTLLGILGVGSYNALQYLALTSSSPINVTLVISSTPLFMMAVGRLFYGIRVSKTAIWGAAVSLIGVIIVLSRGDINRLLALQPVLGDLYVLLACCLMAFYSWLLARPGRADPPESIKRDWAAFLLAQAIPGLAWSGVLMTAEWAAFSLSGQQTPQIHWGPALILALVYVAVGPSIIAFRCWGFAVSRVGPSFSAIVTNLTPVFTALLSVALLGELPMAYHVWGLVFILAGIWLSYRGDLHQSHIKDS